MELDDLKNYASILESLIKSIGVIVGGIWIYLKFIRTRENHPKIEFDVDVNLIGSQDNKILIEVIAVLQNKGLVRHCINNFTCDVLILRSGQKVVHGDDRINYQVLFDKFNPNKVEENQGKDKNDRIVWIPKDWYESFIDAGIKQYYTYLTQVPEDTTFISLYSQFYYKNKDFQTSQRTFSIENLGKLKSH